MKSSRSAHRPDVPASAAPKTSTTGLQRLVVTDDYQILRFRPTQKSYEIDDKSPLAVSVQHAPFSNVTFRIGDKTFSGAWEQGTCCVWPGETPRSLALDQAIDVTAVWLAPTFCARMLETDRFDPTPMFGRRDVVLSQTLYLLALSAEADGSYARLHRDSLVTGLVAHLADRHGVVRAASRLGGLPPARLKRVLDFIEYELHNEITLSKLSALTHVSESHFCTMFRRSMDISPYAYVISQRLQRAKHLLRCDPNKSITEIAFCTGFKSTSHFSTMFLTKTGVTPLSYRRQNC